jgi:RHS repeat-associated protein
MTTTQSAVYVPGVCFAPSDSTGKERDQESGNDYFGARYYNSATDRFLSPDWSAKTEPVPYGRLDDPQSLNLYAYVRGNPLSRIDPDGHCDAPKGLKIGQTGICVASYIRTKWFHFPFRGDGRRTQAFGGTSRVETRMIVDPKKDSVKKTYDYVARSGLGCEHCGPRGDGSNSVSTPRQDSDGNMHFQVSQDGTSAFKPYSLGIIRGSIDNHINLEVSTDGSVHLDPGSTARDFPSLEVYSYTMDSKGNITPTQIVNRPEASYQDQNGDLGKPERPIN